MKEPEAQQNEPAAPAKPAKPATPAKRPGKEWQAQWLARVEGLL